MESFVTRKERIRLIGRINGIILKHQKRILTVDDFDMLYELDVNQLEDVLGSMLQQVRDIKQYSKH